MYMALASLHLEAAVVGIVCIVFLCLFVVSGIRQITKENRQQPNDDKE